MAKGIIGQGGSQRPRYNHFVGSFEPHPLFEGHYVGQVGGITFELMPARSGAGEHSLVIAVVTEGRDRPKSVTLKFN